MQRIEMIHPFKGVKAGEIVTREDELAEWLCSRKYAVPAAAPVESRAVAVVETVQPEAKKATRKK